MNQVLVNAGLQTLKSAGIFSLSTQLRRKSTLPILCYHGISLRDEHEWEGGLYITPAAFRQRLEWLKAWRAKVLPLEEGLERLRSGSLPPRSVVITFDDGFYDFYRYAWPLLAEFSYPCTLYLTTYYSQHRLPVFNLMVRYLFWKAGKTGEDGQAVSTFLNGAEAAGAGTEEKNESARDLAASLGIDYDEILRERLFQIVTPEEAAEMSRGGLDVQLHTHRHRTPPDRELFMREIRDNTRCIEEITGRTPRHFCYPSGVTSPEFLPWLRECDVKSATTCERGLARQGSDPLMLPRYLDGSAVKRLHFESWLSGMR